MEKRIEKRERLEQWINSLSKEQLGVILLDCVQELILSEVVCFYDTTKIPYWDASGDRLDGSERDDED